LIFSYIFGEWEAIKKHQAPDNFYHSVTIPLLLNSILAFCLNWVSFTSIKLTSALTMTIVGNVKQILTIILSLWIYPAILSSTNILGIVITLFGGIAYSIASSRKDRKEPAKHYVDLGLPLHTKNTFSTMRPMSPYS
jgi:uncharacterized protein involved in cysteine biosynthesis